MGILVNYIFLEVINNIFTFFLNVLVKQIIENGHAVTDQIKELRVISVEQAIFFSYLEALSSTKAPNLDK